MTLSSIKSMAEAGLALGDANVSIKASVVLRMVEAIEAAKALRDEHDEGGSGFDEQEVLDKALAAMEE